jgi:hypothetical protein
MIFFLFFSFQLRLRKAFMAVVERSEGNNNALGFFITSIFLLPLFLYGDARVKHTLTTKKSHKRRSTSA